MEDESEHGVEPELGVEWRLRGSSRRRRLSRAHPRGHPPTHSSTPGGCRYMYMHVLIVYILNKGWPDLQFAVKYIHTLKQNLAKHYFSS